MSTISGCDPMADAGDDSDDTGALGELGGAECDPAECEPEAGCEVGADGDDATDVTGVRVAGPASLLVFLGLRNAMIATTSTTTPRTAISIPTERSRRCRRATCRATRPPRESS